MTQKDALSVMRNNEVFSIEYRTFNRSRRSGGVMMRFNSARLMTGALVRENALKKTNHKANFSFDVEIVQDGLRTNKIRRVHLLFVTRINNENVYP